MSPDATTGKAAGKQSPRSAKGAGSRSVAQATGPTTIIAQPTAQANEAGRVIASFVVPALPHPLLIPGANPGYQRIRDAYADVRKQIEALQPDILLLYSTKWPSVIGHQVQTDPAPEWVHVDEEWHELGSIPYKLRVDASFGEAFVAAGQARGLEMRAVNYKGFPVDTGTIVALQLLNKDNKWPASMVSSNMYADRAETIVLGKAARDALQSQGKRAVAIAVTALSNRLFSAVVPFAEDRIHSRKDDEWNRKYLEFLARGRLEDASQLAREFAHQANGDSKMKAIWWLAAVSGASNNYDGKVYAYEAIYGTGAALVGLVPTQAAALDKEFDEDEPEVHLGDRNVLGGANPFEASGDGLRNAQLARAGPGAGRTQATPQLANKRPTGEEGDDEAAEEAMERWSGAHSSADPDVAAGYPGAPSSPTDRPQKSQTPQMAQGSRGGSRPSSAPGAGVVHAKSAPKPVGAYAHARRVGDLLFLAGIGPRTPGTDVIPGGPIRDAAGKPLPYDVKAQTRQVIENVKRVLAESGAKLEDVFDVQVFLTDMKADFKAFNEVYNDAFAHIQATRTTMEVGALPTPIAVEFKVIAHAPQGR